MISALRVPILFLIITAAVLYFTTVQTSKQNVCLSLQNELFLLVTDQGFLTEEQVIWATLSNVEGDCVFVDANFRTSQASRTPPPPPLPEQSACATDKPMTGISQEDQEYG